MEPYTPNTEMFENGIIYTVRYHVPSTPEELEAELAEAQNEYPELREMKTGPTPTVEDMLRWADGRYSYKPRLEAKEGQAKFIQLAIYLSKNYEISMEIKRHERTISVNMDIFASPFFGEVKQLLDALLHMASSYDFIPKSEEYVTLSLDYALFDRYDNRTGEKVDWM